MSVREIKNAKVVDKTTEPIGTLGNMLTKITLDNGVEFTSWSRPNWLSSIEIGDKFDVVLII